MRYTSSRKRGSLRRVPALSRWWGDLLFFWHTGTRLPWFLGGGAFVVLTLFTTLMHAMVANDTKHRELTCLAMNVYYEARGEPVEGQYGVAEVTMNRVVDPRYPGTICEVVYQQRWDYLRKRHVSAFSWTEFDVVPQPQGSEWETAVAVAEDTFNGRRSPTLQGAVHYHAVHIRPSWSQGKEPVARIGRHMFYQ
jgi:spore germination cell wall hydrolase CwlJ-like protein